MEMTKLKGDGNKKPEVVKMNTEKEMLSKILIHVNQDKLEGTVCNQGSKTESYQNLEKMVTEKMIQLVKKNFSHFPDLDISEFQVETVVSNRLPWGDLKAVFIDNGTESVVQNPRAIHDEFYIWLHSVILDGKFVVSE